MQQGALRAPEQLPEHGAAAVDILGGRADAIATPPVGRPDPGIALTHHDREPVQILQRILALGLAHAGATVGMDDQPPVPVRGFGNDQPGPGLILQRQAGDASADRTGAVDRLRIRGRAGARDRGLRTRAQGNGHDQSKHSPMP